MAWPSKPKTSDSLGVIAEVITNATYGEVIRLGSSLAEAIPIEGSRDPRIVAEALYKWATAQSAPALTLTSPIPDGGKSIDKNGVTK